MRLHHLSVTAFGPFADTVEVDFDALADGRLFLLTGATGSGKTSILDAVCFALYGDVPGDRSGARRLRSDLAEERRRTEVSLECTLGGRRFRVVRSPSWERPKKRGTGMTTEPARVTLTERCDGTWVHRSSRIDETAQLVTDLVGLTQTQFTQVAMLPQGRFQAFLRADSDSRQRLLQQIFRTNRFEHVERWLRDRRQGLRVATTRGHDAVAALVHRLGEAAGAPLPETWDEHDLGLAADEGEIAPWADELVTATTSLKCAAEAAVAQWTATHEADEATLGRARTLADRQARHERAVAELSQLQLLASSHAEDVARLAQARRAAPLVPLADRISTCVATAAASRTTAVEAVAAAGALLAPSPVPETDRGFAGERDRATAAAATMEAVATRALAADELEARVRADDGELGTVRTRLHELDQRADELPSRVVALEETHAEASAAASALGSLDAEVTAARSRLADAERVCLLEVDLAAARDDLRAAIDVAQACRETWLEIQEARLTGMAAELAHDLAVGACCPVCGSLDHPSPASPAPGSVGSEKAARKALDDAEAVRQAHDSRVRDLETELALTAQRAGGARDAVAAEVADLVAQRSALADLAAPAPALAAALDEARRQLADVSSDREALRVRESALAAAREGRALEAAAHRSAVAESLSGTGHDDAAAYATSLRACAAACDRAASTLLDATSADDALALARREAGRAARESGFDDIEEASDAALPAAAIDRLDQRVEAHRTSLASATALAADPELVAATEQPTPDLEALAAAEQESAAALAAALGDRRLAESREERIRALSQELSDEVAAWLPVRREHDAVASLASLAEGRSSDNVRRMRLSAFVLAFRLAQVVAAANERLAGMSDQRYTLEPSEERTSGERRAGLGLLVRDDWSGERRDPATLSGGETFVVSLALALGLADVITQEAGGADLDTLFVDEGFGSLDADTLDDVMGTLDSLRAGGRVVGVVSHVPEMRDRIPTQLAVHKGRKGSTVSILAR